jgi:hypothetical protein
VPSQFDPLPEWPTKEPRRPLKPTFVQCEECGRIDLDGAGSKADVVDEHEVDAHANELVVYCPSCWKREFECPEEEL